MDKTRIASRLNAPKFLKQKLDLYQLSSPLPENPFSDSWLFGKKIKLLCLIPAHWASLFPNHSV